MKARRYILVLCILCFVTLSFTGCRPKGILHSWEMRKVLVDLHKTDATLQVAGKQFGDGEEKAMYYAVVLDRHGITQAQFDSSLVWYTAHPQLFDKIYPKVLADLKAEEDLFVAEYTETPEMLLSPGGLKRAGTTARISRYTAAQLDSITQVNLYGPPVTWQEPRLMHNFENQLFPQIGVLR